jgi:hypothetical protein
MTRRLLKGIVAASLILVINLGFFSLAPAQGQAQAGKATLLVSPSKGTYQIGEKFNISVYVNSGGGTGINVVESTITFTDNVSVTNINQSGTVIELWQAKPSFSNKNGTISFGGGMTSAYSGSAGKIFTISFSALKAGAAKIAFGGSSVLAADGLGTNIYSGANFATFTITDKAPEKPKTIEPLMPTETVKKPSTESLISSLTATTSAKPVSNAMLPPAPDVTSPTHPNADQWYPVKDARMEWKNLQSIIGVSLLMNQIASSTLGNTSDGTIQYKEFKSLADGEHYFHIKLQNKDGWGPTTHRKVRVDTEAPMKPQLTIADGGDTSNPMPLLKIYSNDKTSGIEKFKLSLGAVNKELPARDYLAEPYQLEKLLPGAYSATVYVYDRAGNIATSSIEFIVDALRAPTITDIPKEIKIGDDLTIRGASFYPKSTISLFIGLGDNDPQRYEIKTDDNGDWNYFHLDKSKLVVGGYSVWAKVSDDRGAESLDGRKQYMSVVSPGIVLTYGIYIIIALIFIIILELLYIIYIKKGFVRDMERIQDETTGAQRRVGDVFLALNEEVDELVELADKRPGLSESERRVKEKIKEALSISEEFLNKEIEDIEKEVVVEKKGKKK